MLGKGENAEEFKPADFASIGLPGLFSSIVSNFLDERLFLRLGFGYLSKLHPVVRSE